jgi:hypothetical protein
LQSRGLCNRKNALGRTFWGAGLQLCSISSLRGSAQGSHVAIWRKADITIVLNHVRFRGVKRTSRERALMSAFDGEFNRSTQHLRLLGFQIPRPYVAVL